MRVRVAGLSAKGLGRNRNEDVFAVCKDVQDKDWACYESELFDVGRWGSMLLLTNSTGSLIASGKATTIAYLAIMSDLDKLDEIPESSLERESLLEDLLVRAHRSLVTLKEEQPLLEGSGTTVILAWIIGKDLYVAWVGDSRCYLLDQEASLSLLTEDHSLVGMWVKFGRITREQARSHYSRHMVTQFLGMDEIPNPEVKWVDLCHQKRILLCSRGLYAVLPDHEIEEVLKYYPDTESAAVRLVENATKEGGKDNMTVLLLDIV